MKRIFLYLLAITLLPQVISAAVLVGKTEGAFSVSPTGAATYTIPIKVQSGLSDFVPSISLAYSSQSGNGIAGVGFGISGLSSISIAQKTIYFDNHVEEIKQGEDNAFTLDGQRLLLKEGQNGQTGATYRTENEQYNIISITDSQNGTPATFQVKATNGTTYRYGSSTGRRTLSNGKSYQWALDYAEDILGNYIQYNYSQEGVLYPTSITYGRNIHGTAGVDCMVSFTYESRPDTIPVYLFGEMCFLTKRLKSIECKYAGNVYRTYTLNYTEDVFSHLISVTETGTGSASVPPTTFEWEVPAQFQLDCNSRSMETDLLEDFSKEKFFSGDLDGDGITELISMETKSDNPLLPDETTPKRTWFYGRKWNPETQKFEFCYSYDTWAGTQLFDLYSKTVSGGFVMHASHRKENYLVMPYVIRDNSDDSKSLVFKFMEEDFVLEDSVLNIPLKGSSDDVEDFPLYTIFDADKDGLDNIFVVEKEKHNGTYPAYLVSYNRETGYLRFTEINLNLIGVPDKIRCADFNADGMTDLLISTAYGYYIYWNKNGGFSDSDRYSKVDPHNVYNKYDILELGDFNGDGLVDLIVRYSMGGDWSIAQNTGTVTGDFFSFKGFNVISNGSTLSSKDKEGLYCIVQDINGDGRSDAVVGYPKKGQKGSGYIYVLVSQGNTLKLKSKTFLEQNYPDYCHITAGNFYGQANAQIMYYGKGLNQEPVGWHVLENSTIKPSSQKIVSITDGLGATDSIAYSLLTDKDVYSVDKSHNYPLIPLSGPMPVVKTLTESIPTDSRTTNYSYANGFVHVQGKGFIGFEDLRTESSVGVVTDTHCKLDSTFYVLVSSTTSESNINGAEMSRGGQSMRIERVGSSGTGTRSYRTIHSDSFKKDSFNNFSSGEGSNSYRNGFPLSQSSDDGLVDCEKEITYWESPLSNVYLKGLPEEIEITKTALSNDIVGDDIYENITYERDPATGLVLKETRTRNDLPVSIDGYSYNEYGQVTQHYTVAYNSTDTLVTRYEYNTKGQLSKEYDPKGLYRRYTYSSSNGTLASVYGFDGVTTRYTYDGLLRETSRKRATIETCQTTRALSSYGGGVYYIKEAVTGKTPVTTYYDAWERKIAESAPLADGTIMYTDYHYLSNGQLGFVSFPHKYNETTSDGTTYTYDALFRKISEVDSNGKTNTWSYTPRCVDSRIDGVRKVTYYYAPDIVQCVGDSLKEYLPREYGVAGGTVYYDYNMDEKISSINVGHTDMGPDCEDHTASYEYDDYGRLIQTTDVNGVTKEYSYDVNGYPYRTTIAGSYVETIYDKYGILRSKSWADSGESPHTVTYTYDNKFRLTQEEGEGYTNTISYDTYGRVTNKRNSVFDTSSKYVTTYYQYNADNKVSMASSSLGKFFPSVVEEFSYRNGYLVSDTLDHELLWRLTKQDYWGRTKEEKDRIGTTTHTYDDYGHMLTMNRVSSHPISETYTYDIHTGNMISKNDIPITYDEQNRLTGYGDYTYSYDRKGNITNQPFVGEFSYSEYRVEDLNADSSYVIDDSLRITYYKAIERPKSIENEHYKAEFFYDGNGDRYMMKVYGKYSGRYGHYLTRYYLSPNVEWTEENTGNRICMYYAGGDAYTAPAVKVMNWEAGTNSIYQITRDNLGSVLQYENEDDSYYNFRFSYSPWGVRTHVGDETHFYQPGEFEARYSYCPFYRTYTGHEDLWMFGLLNANARLYSPYLGRFVSPDPLLNSEGSAWDYNPYVYARNNPYKYMDRNGEFPWLIVSAAVFGGFGNVFANFDNIDNAGSFFKSFSIGAGAGALGGWLGPSAAVGLGFGATGAISGAFTGAITGFTSSVTEGLMNWAISGTKFSFTNCLMQTAFSAAIGGIMGGIDAVSKHTNFFTGRAKIDLNGACFCSECWPFGLEIGDKTITGTYVGKFEGVNVFETEKLGNIKQHAYKAVTVPERGIIAGKGVYTSGLEKGIAMMQHEFGHILQYRMYPAAYWSVIGIESGLSCSYASFKGDLSLHWNFWTEKWANYLSKGYFGIKWLGSKFSSMYPVGNISPWNKIRMSVSQLNNSIM
ncbi:MAG: VCBS repeat-containing protein [Bacteroidaceae bacterium]|nr:VCBS repeat-containing protein [Bacteroidaceae bacterium]